MSIRKLEPQTYYLTRDGRKAYVAGICPNPERIEREYQAVGFVYSSKTARWEDCAWSNNGTYRTDRDSDLDLVYKSSVV